MKHFWTSVVIFISIISGCFAERIYVNKTFSMLETKANTILKKNIINENYMNDINIIKNKFYSKKNMLLFFINKEHINHIEINILLLENAAENEDIETCREKTLEIINTVSYINQREISID